MPEIWGVYALSFALLIVLCAALWKLYSGESSAPGGQRAFEEQRWERLMAALDSLRKARDSKRGDLRRHISEAALEGALSLMGSERGSLMLWNEQVESLEIAASRNVPAEHVSKFKLKPGEGIAGRVFEMGELLYVPAPQEDPAFVPSDPVPQRRLPMLSVPLCVQGKALGVLNVEQTPGAASLAEHNAKLLVLLADETAMALENLHLADDLQNFYLELVETLARAVDAKDSYTHDHADRARANARRIGRALGLPDEEIRQVEYAALLHDVGKIGIKDSILLKPGKLTKEEYEEMKRHATIGHEILRPVRSMGPVAEMVLCHQEWYNGQGYPNGLKGEQIPLGARIVAVIDAWDAMTSDRPYRKALPREKAIAELKEWAGRQFDPMVVETFLNLIESEAKDEDALHHTHSPGEPGGPHAEGH